MRVDGNQTILVWHALASGRRHIRDMGPEGSSGYHCRFPQIRDEPRKNSLAPLAPPSTAAHCLSKVRILGLGFNVGQPTPSFRAARAETRNPGDDRGSRVTMPAEVRTKPESWNGQRRRGRRRYRVYRGYRDFDLSVRAATEQVENFQPSL